MAAQPGATGSTPSLSRPIRRRSGGRSERVRTKVAEAVLSLLSEGPNQVSVAEVAERSGVHRTTIYRWWPTPSDLLREALTVHTARLTTPDEGSWVEDVSALAAALADFFADPVEMAMNAAMASGADPEGDEVQIEHWTPVMAGLSQIVDRAKGRGEIAADADARTLMYLLVGPLLMQTVLFHAPPDPQLVRRIATAVTRAFAAAQ